MADVTSHANGDTVANPLAKVFPSPGAEGEGKGRRNPGTSLICSHSVKVNTDAHAAEVDFN